MRHFAAGVICTILGLTVYGSYSPPKCPHCFEKIHFSDRMESGPPRAIGMRAWNVYHNGQTDIVHFHEFMDRAAVYEALVRHNGYSVNIALELR